MWYDDVDDDVDEKEISYNKYDIHNKPDIKMHLFAYIDMMDQIMESIDRKTEQNKIKQICLQVGQNLFDRSYYCMRDSTTYLDLWKYWVDSHDLYVNEEEMEYLWDHVFI